MKTLYLECNMGAAGDMLMAALLELLPDAQAFLDRMNALGLPGVRVSAVPEKKCGVSGMRVAVTVDGEEECSDAPGKGIPHLSGEAMERVGVHSCDHHHMHSGEAVDHSTHAAAQHMEKGHSHTHTHGTMAEIAALIAGLDLPERVKSDALAVYRLISDAESRVHGCTVAQVHFHEVGAMDAIADVVGVSLLVHLLAPDRILASPVHVGSGQVRCAHGILPVPAPATAELLRGIPSYGGAIAGELCTPTGAALLRHFACDFCGMPVMRTERIGYGMGKKDFPAANCIRAFLGETESQPTERVFELSCNLDDMTPEAVAFACERLLQAGALDAYTVPLNMKKGRPGVLLGCLCRAEKREALVRLLFLHTTTLGVREAEFRRYMLERTVRVSETPGGPVRVKCASGYGISREKLEYADLARIAEQTGEPLSAVADRVRRNG